MRKKIMGFMVPWEAKTGYPPFKEPYTAIKDIAVIGFVTNGFVSLNPKIKTVKDFAGKRVGLGTSPSAARVDMPKAGVLASGAKNVKFSEHGFLDGVRALSDGLIDGLLSATFMRDAVNMKFGPNPALGELMATKKVYFVSFDKEAYDRAHKEFEKKAIPPWYSFAVPPGGVKGQTEPWVVQGGPITWSCDASMPDEVVYEIIRIMANNTAGFEKYHPLGKTITPVNMAKLGDDSVVHPGALKYYKEKGVEVGSF
jgi:TRAP transporter TAXI family solute receptor